MISIMTLVFTQKADQIGQIYLLWREEIVARSRWLIIKIMHLCMVAVVYIHLDLTDYVMRIAPILSDF